MVKREVENVESEVKEMRKDNIEKYMDQWKT